MNIKNKIFRKADVSDLNRILEIEEASFDTPWSREALRIEIEENELSEVYVVELEFEDGKRDIAGFLNYVKILGEIDINNVAIDKKYRNLGLGDFLLSSTIESLPDRELNLTLEVRHDNYPAINLYKKYGFKEEGIRRDYYKVGAHAIIMWRRGERWKF